jgi:3-deoxy-D-manno-octulosonic-acid transferase
LQVVIGPGDIDSIKRVRLKMYLIYNILLWLIFPFLLVYHLYRSVSRARPPALLQRFGLDCHDAVAVLHGRRPIWVHAVSVGETIAVKPLLIALRSRFPDTPLVVSNMTETGRGVAQGIREIDCCIYFPFDYRSASARLLEKINPLTVIVAETEIWPNFIFSARQRNIPTIIVNGRISDRSFGRYLRLGFFFRPVLADISALCMQTAEDARRIVAIGAVADKVHVTRNLKFDIPARTVTRSELQAVRSTFRLVADCRVITAGSTHPGEEEQVLDAFSAILAKVQNALLVLVPRHPERAGEVAELLARRGFRYRLRSQLQADSAFTAAGEVLLVDTIGELLSLYVAADIVFVGGSLVPLGGHNLLEPASLGRPVLFGEHVANFREIASLVLNYGAACQVGSADELAALGCALLADEKRMQIMGENGRRLLQEQGGATGLNMAIIESVVQGKRQLAHD